MIMCRIAPSRVMGWMLVVLGRGMCASARYSEKGARWSNLEVSSCTRAPIAVWRRVGGCAHHDESDTFRKLHV